MKKILWKLLEMFDNNWGYTTPLQKRFHSKDECTISHNKTKETRFDIGETVHIVEIGRHDYLVKNNESVMGIVYQFELN